MFLAVVGIEMARFTQALKCIAILWYVWILKDESGQDHELLEACRKAGDHILHVRKILLIRLLYFL